MSNYWKKVTAYVKTNKLSLKQIFFVFVGKERVTAAWCFPLSLNTDTSKTVPSTVCEKCPYSVFFRSVFSRIQTDYGEILCISSFSVRMR